MDTSVLVAASRSRNGASFEVVQRIPDRQFQIAISVGLYTEWRAVMSRSEHLPSGTTSEDAQGFLRYLASTAYLTDVHYLWRPFLRDPNDDLVLECAVAAGASHIVTHNLRDFAGVQRFGLAAITPADLLAILRSTP